MEEAAKEEEKAAQQATAQQAAAASQQEASSAPAKDSKKATSDLQESVEVGLTPSQENAGITETYYKMPPKQPEQYLDSQEVAKLKKNPESAEPARPVVEKSTFAHLIEKQRKKAVKTALDASKKLVGEVAVPLAKAMSEGEVSDQVVEAASQEEIARVEEEAAEAEAQAAAKKKEIEEIEAASRTRLLKEIDE